MSLVPSPFQRLASATVAGLVGIGVQTFAGVKTFTSALVASAGIQLSALWNTNGSGAADIAVKVGTSLADGSVNATAKLLSLRTGIGGTEVEKAYVLKVGAGIQLNAGGSVLDMNDVVGFKLALSGNGQLSFAAGQADLYSVATLILRSGIGTGAADVCAKTGTTVADGSTNAGAKLWSVRTGIGGTEVEYLAALKSELRFTSGGASKLSWNAGGANRWEIEGTPGGGYLRLGNNSVQYFGLRFADGFGVSSYGFEVNNVSLSQAYFSVASAVGRVDQWGTDLSGTPGAATVNKPTGKNAIAAGAASVVVTNSLVTAASRVMITPHARDATCKELIAVPAAGSFTVSGTANATAALPFSWEVSNIL